MTKIQRPLPHIFALFASVLGIGIDITASQSKAGDAEWADLELTFVYDASACPLRKRIVPLADASCMPESLMPLSEELIVDGDTMGIQNIVMYLDPKHSGLLESDMHPELRSAPAEPAVLTVRNCVFEPHVFISRVGQKLKLINSDDYGHSPYFIFFANAPESRMHPPGHAVEIEPMNSEKAPSPIQCNIHPWMQAYVLVFDHPYSGISNPRGVLKIEKLPAGKPITFKVWHESMEKSIDQVTFGGQSTKWAKGNFQWTLKPGLNNLGIAKIKPEVFKSK